jgi:hypothetical protein
MMRAKTQDFISAAICLALACAALHTQAQSNTGVSEESNRAVEAVDASVHAEVDGQPHELTPAESPRERRTPLHAAKRHPVTVVWPAHADTSTTGTDKKGTDNKTDPLTFGISSFRPGTQPGASSAGQAAASANAKNDDSGQRRSWRLNAPRAHSLYGSATPAWSLRSTVPPVSASDQTPGLSAPFGRTPLGLAASTSPFPKRDSSKHKDQTSAKRHEQHARKFATSGGTKSSFDSPATTRH